MPYLSQRLWVLAMTKTVTLIALLVTSSSVIEGGVQMMGSVVVNHQGHAMLSLKLQNDSDTAICFETWFPSRDVMIDVMYTDSFILENADGTEVEYQSRIADLDPTSVNRRVYLLKEGENAQALIDLSALYRLDHGSYTVSYLLSTLPCAIYGKQDSYLTSSNNLKYLQITDNLAIASDIENVVILEPIHFDVPINRAK